jgi:type IV secretion system protein VirB6
MTPACTALPQGAGFVSAIASYVDCQAQVLGSGAWSALAAPGSSRAIVLTGFLTILIALIGYNLLLGHSLTVREGTLAAVKVGAIFALATSWPAYRTLVYDLVTDGPAQLVAEIGPAAGVVGSDGTLLQRLDATDEGLVQLAILGAGQYPPGTDSKVPPAPFAGFDSMALGGSRILFLVTALAGLGAVRVVAGLMLALGPFFIAFLMFESTRSLFEGWIRVLAGAALAGAGVSIALGLELALMEPWLSDVLARRMADEPLPAVPTELFVITLLFTLIAVALVRGCIRLALAFRLAPVMRTVAAGAQVRRSQEAGVSAVASSTRIAGQIERSRAAAVAAMLAGMSRRESLATLPGAQGAAGARRPSIVRRDESAAALTPVGRSFVRRGATRVSARANRRDSAA